MNRKDSRRTRSKSSDNASFGTYLPNQGILQPDSAKGSDGQSMTDTLAPASPRNPRPTGTIAFDDIVPPPSPQSFASVYKTNGTFDAGLHDVVINTGEDDLDDDDGDCVQTIDSGDAESLQTIDQPNFDDDDRPGTGSDYQQTIHLPEDSHQMTIHLPEDSYQRTIDLPEDSVAKLTDPGKSKSRPRRSSRRGPFSGDSISGKSTWQLQIREKSLKGHVSGVRNRIPTQADDVVGFLSAFVDKPDIAEYEVINELGKGNMGIVYEATQTSLNRELAIKSLNPKKGSNTRYEQEMFVSEAVVTANLVHPNIVPIHDLGRTEDGKLFYSMKKVTGTSWDKKIREMSLEDNLDIFMKVCDAVAYAHSRGVINRDLKPENVVIGSYGEVIVLDWGLAVTTEVFPKQESILLDYRGGAGTPVYMAPELVSDDISMVGYHSDIYLLGAILFEMIEGFPPHLLRAYWNIEDPHEQFASIVTAAMTNQVETNVQHPGELIDIAFQAMATNIDDRFQSVEEMQEAIRQYRITGHAEEFYQKATTSTGNQSYDNYQSSVALFDEATRKWPGNERALVGNRLARKGFAKLALKRGDYDLGLHVIENLDGPEFTDVRRKLKGRKRGRTIVKWTWQVLAVCVVVMTGVAYQMQQNAEAAQDLAVQEQAKALEERQKTEEAIAELEVEQERADEAVERQQKAEKEYAIAQSNLKKTQTELEQTQADAEQAKLDAEKQNQLAMMAKAAADKAQEIATAKQLEADKAIKEAEVATAAAKTALMEKEKAAQEAKAAKELADRAAQQAAEAVEERLKVEWDRFNIEYDMYFSLGKYEKALSVAQSAIQKATIAEGTDGYNERFSRPSRQRSLKRKLEAAQSKHEEQVRRLNGNVNSAAMGRTGRVLALATPSNVEILYSNQAGTALNQLQSANYRGLEANVEVEISPDENFLVATGRGHKRLWSLLSGTPQRFDLLVPASLRAEMDDAALDYRKARFSPDSRYLFLIAGNEDITVEVYDLVSGRPECIEVTDLAGSSNNSFRVTDIEVLAHHNSQNSTDLQMVYLSEGAGGSSVCKFVTIEFASGRPVFSRSIPFQDARPDQYQASQSIIDLRSERMQRLKVSPGGQWMAIQVGNKFLQIFSKSADDSNAPFETNFGGTLVETSSAVTSIAFSEDGERLVVGTANGYLENFEWNSAQQKFVPLTRYELWDGHLLGGFNSNPLEVVFVAGNRDAIFAIGRADTDADNGGYVAVEWDLNTYRDYKTIFADLHAIIQAADARATSSIEIDSQPEMRQQPAPHLSCTQSAPVEIDFAALETVGFNQDASENADEPATRRRWRVSRSTESARFSRDGKRILVAADDRAAHVFARDKATVMFSSRPRSRFYDPSYNVFEEGHIPELSDILFLPPDGSRLLTRDFFGSVSVWDAKDDADGFAREVSRILTADFGMAASPDGKWVFASAREVEEITRPDGTLEEQTRFVGQLWSTADFETDPTPKSVRTFRGKHNRLITAVAFSPDSSLVVTADRRGHLVLWDRETGETVAEVPGTHGNDQVSGIAFLNDQELISAGYDGKIQRWILKQDRLVLAEEPFQFQRRNEPDDYLISLSISPDRQQFATISVKTQGTQVARNTSDDNARVRTSKNLIRLTVWSVQQPHEPVDLIARESSELSSGFNQGIAWSTDGTILAHIYPVETETGTTASELSLYDAQTWKKTKRYRPRGLTGTASRVAFSPANDGENQVLATFDGRIAHLWQLENVDGAHLAEFRSHETVFSADFSFDRNLVATASDSVRVFISNETAESHGQTVFRKADAHAGRVEEVAFSRIKGDYDFATVGGDGTLKVWDWNWEPHQPAPPPESPVAMANLTPLLDMQMDETLNWSTSLDWSQNKELLATTFQGELFVFQYLDDRLQRLTFPMPEDVNMKFNSCAISRDGKQLAAGGVRRLADGRTLQSQAIVWNVGEDGSLTIDAVFEGKHSPNPDSNRLAGITAISFGFFENTLLTGGTDGAVLLWDWEPREEGDDISIAEQFDDYTTLNNEKPHGVSTVTSIDVSETGDVVSTGTDGWVAFWAATDVE